MFYTLHPLKMSNSKLVITDTTITVQLRMFIDDVTHHIQQKYRIKQADFLTIESNGALALQRYLKECFYLIQDGKHIFFNIENVSMSKDGVALQVQLKSAQRFHNYKGLHLRNTIMCDVFKKQENIVRFKTRDNELKILSYTIDDPIQSLQ